MGRHTGSSSNVRKDAETQRFAHDLPPPEVSVVEEVHALHSRVAGLPLAPKVSAEVKMPAGAWKETFLRCVCVCVCVCVRARTHTHTLQDTCVCVCVCVCVISSVSVSVCKWARVRVTTADCTRILAHTQARFT